MRKLSTIKTGICVLLVSFAAAELISQTAPSPSVIRPDVKVEFDNEILSLAKGYELAFEKLPSGGKYIEVSTSKGPEYLPGSVRSVVALEGVLLIQMRQGLIYVFSAKDIIKLTNEKPSS